MSSLKYKYSSSLEVGNPIASILKSNVIGNPSTIWPYEVSNFMGFTIQVPVPLSGDLGYARGPDRTSHEHGTFPKLGAPYFGVLIVRILLFGVLY